MRQDERRGFTTVDVMISMAIVAIIGAAAMPIVHGYLTRGKLETTVREIVDTARYAQARSQAAVDDTSWGVAVTGGTVTLFRGASYATRTASYDQITVYPSHISVSGTYEYVFARRTGQTVGGTLTLTTSSALVKNITVNEFGMINF